MPEIVAIRPNEAIDSDSPVHKDRRVRYNSFRSDDDGNPTGGYSTGEGYSINWQDGVREPSGAIVEDVIASVIDRLKFFQGELTEQGGQGGKFRCRENALTITHLEEAIHWLNHRTIARRRRGVEGSYNS